MDDITFKFKVREFASSKDKDYIDALKIYFDSTPSSIRTDTNQISYWLDNYNNTFDDKFYVLGFYINDIVAGYAEMVYFKQEQCVVIDYLAIDKNFKAPYAFYGFIAGIKKFIETQAIEYKYVVTEIGYLNNEKEPCDYSKKLIRLLKQQNFGVLKSLYYQPQLGSGNYESEMKALLMIYSNSEIDAIKKETFLQIVKTIYYKHYLRWYEKFEDKVGEYKNNLDKLYRMVEKASSKASTIKINGYKFEMAPPSPPAQEVKWSILFISLFYIVLLTFIMILLKSYFNLATHSLALIFILAVITFFAILASFSESNKPMKIFEKLLPLVKRFSGKSK